MIRSKGIEYATGWSERKPEGAREREKTRQNEGQREGTRGIEGAKGSEGELEEARGSKRERARGGEGERGGTRGDRGSEGLYCEPGEGTVCEGCGASKRARGNEEVNERQGQVRGQ